MNRTIKKAFIFLIMLLPVVAFAGNTGLELFAPNPSDFSINLLERTFGAIGNTLHGQGNQITGLLLGIFNAMWVIVIGLGILFVVWDSVMNAAHSGEMMRGHGKKAAFSIIRIVAGFCLVIPNTTTGYSLAQNAVVWVAVQGVGLADTITQKAHDYMQAGGDTFTIQPATASDVEPLTTQAANILKSEICMYKMQDILDDKKKQEDDALKSAGSEPNPPREFDKMGYSVNVGENSGRITFGSKNPNYNPDEPNSTEYLNECGNVHWQLSIAIPGTESESNSIKKNLLGYMQSGVTQIVVNLLPLARELASAKLSDSEEDAAVFEKLSGRVATAMASSSVSYATLLDPIKGASQVSSKEGLKDKLTELNDNGWVFMPIMAIMPGLYRADSIQLVNYMPTATPPDLTVEPFAKLKVLDSQDKQQINDAMDHVDSDSYKPLADAQLQLMVANNTWPTVDFTSLYTGTTGGNYTGGLSGLFDGTRSILQAGATTANGTLDMSKGVLQGIKSIADFFVDGYDVDINICELVSHISSAAASLIPDDDCNIGYTIGGWVDGDTSGLQDGIDAIQNLKNNTNNAVNNAIANLNSLVNEITNSETLAVKGGMTNELSELTSQLGPLGPLYATLMTAMIGKSITSFSNNLFNPNYNALVSSIKLGGEMMVGSMESIMLSGKIVFVTTMVQAGIDGLSKFVGMIPVVGKPIGGIMNIGTNLVHKGIESFTSFHIALAIMLFLGGLTLYVLVPLTFIVAFATICLRWIGMVLINVIAAPIFCFNLIRADSEGMAGRGERFLADLAKTALTPAILSVGAIAFLILFNIGFIILTTIFTSFLPMLAKAYNHPLLVPVSLSLMLMIFSVLMVYISQTLSTICTTDFVNHVSGVIGDSIQHLHDSSPAQEIREVVRSGGHQGTQHVKGMASGGTGFMPGKDQDH